MNQVKEFFTRLFQYAEWPAKWSWGKWSGFHGWLTILSDLLIWSAFLFIAFLTLKRLRGNSGKSSRGLQLLFALLFFFCGTAHLLDAASFWQPFNRLDTLLRLLTGVIGWIAVISGVKYLRQARPAVTVRAIEPVNLAMDTGGLGVNNDELIGRVFNNAPDAIIIIDAKGVIKEWNPAAEKMFGWHSEEVKGNYLYNFIVPAGFWDIHEKAMNNFMKSGEGIVLNRPIVQPALRKDKPAIEVEFIVSPVKIREDYLFIGFLRDITEKAKAVEALRESEERYRLLTSEVRDYAIFMLSPEGLVTSWNEGAERIKGYTEEEAIGSHFSIFYTDEAKQKNFPIEELNIAQKEGRLEIEGWRIKKDGSLFFAHVVITALTHKGKILGYSKITQDITLRKQNEEKIQQLNARLERRVIERTEALQQSEKKYRKLFENSPMPLWVIELPSLRFLDVNEAAIRHYGYSREEFLSMTTLQIRPDEEKERFLNYNRNNESGILNTGVWKHLKKDGTLIFTEVSSHQLVFDDRPARLVLNIDITERKKAEERLEVALESGKIGIWELDMVNDTSMRNSRYDQIFGSEVMLDQWGMKDFLNAVLPADEEKVRNAMEEARKTKTLYIECRIVLRDESQRWIFTSGRVILDSRQKPVKMLGTVIDITDLKQAEEKIRLLNNELEERVEVRTLELNFAIKELESFSYSVSHDLRAPLRAIHGYSQLLNENYKDQLDEEGKRMLGRVMLNTQKMGHLIDDLLEFSRLGKASLRKANIELTPIAQEAINEANPGGELQYKVELEELGMAFADKVILRQVFLNLLLNAFKYSSKKEHPEIKVGVTETEKGKTYFVRDNGAGFDMAYYNKLFGVFQRLHRQDEFEGTGVGLALVQKIVTKHGGEVWADAKVDEGATFYFTLSNKLESRRKTEAEII